MAVSKVSGLNFTSGPISFDEIRKIYKEVATGPISLSDVYRNTDVNAADPVVPNATENTNVPTSGTIDASDFRNTIKAITVEQTGDDANLLVQDHLTKFDTANLNTNTRKNFIIKGTVYSSDRTKFALTLETTSTLKNFAVVNNGKILGASGQGATSSTTASSGGGAIKLRNYIKVINNGDISAGGGGGGRGATGGTGGTGGTGVYYTFNSKQCNFTYSTTTYQYIPKTCYYFVAKFCTQSQTTQQPVFVANYTFSTQYGTIFASYLDQKQLGAGGKAGGCFASCIPPANTNPPDTGGSGTGVYCQGQCNTTPDGKKKCSNCTNPIWRPYSYQGITGFSLVNNSFSYGKPVTSTQTTDCSFQGSFDCSYTSSSTSQTTVYYDCSTYTTTYTSGGSGGTGGAGGSGGRGRGYDYSTGQLNGAGGSANGTGKSGGTNAGTGGDGKTGGSGGSGGDWGQKGSDGLTSTKGDSGKDGNYTTGLAGSDASGATSGAPAGNYIDGLSYAQLVNNSTVKGNTAN